MAPIRYTVTDMHTAGEPVRIFTGGVPELRGATLLEKRRDAMANHDAVRRHLMFEPRGHREMYGVWPTAASHPGAALAVLFTHNEGYSTMCGHATIALGRWVLDQGLVPKRAPETRFVLECPCGPVEVFVAVDADGRIGDVAFESVPAFLAVPDLRVEVPGLGPVTLDIAYGGAFYAILPASRLGLDLRHTPVAALHHAMTRISEHLRATETIRHPRESDLGFLYGTILTDDAVPGEGPSWNLCWFGDGQIDRSPTGSGVTARLALEHAKERIAPGVDWEVRGLSGAPFTGRIARVMADGVVARVAGRGHYAGEASFTVEPDDPLPGGLAVPERLETLWR
ncbi:MAG TPA: proline racemase family protein [Inquilinus sp.]|nr:proline racemase family protein [Inquilinus sp.]